MYDEYGTLACVATLATAKKGLGVSVALPQYPLSLSFPHTVLIKDQSTNNHSMMISACKHLYAHQRAKFTLDFVSFYYTN